MENQYNFFTEIEIRISDINYGGHLSNDRYLTLFHDARIRYLNQFGLTEFNLGNETGLIMLESHINYKAEVFLGDKLYVAVRIKEIGPIKFLIEYQINRNKDNKIAATGYTQMAGFDYQAKKVAKLPLSFVNKVKQFENIE